ncbi:MAG: GIY-YIG nuclease family protein [Patescibacteria group bacterium]
MFYYIYVLKSKTDDSLYIGYTNDLKRRFEEHNSGKNKSTKFKIPFELIYYEAYKSSSDAKYREKNMKRFAQAYSALKQRIKNSLAS